MANGLVHRDVFPDGSEPDSISWKQWNAEHVIYGPSGEVLSFGAVADGEYVRRVGNEFVGGTPAGGGSSIIGPIVVTYADFVDIGGGVGVIDPFYTVPEGSFLTGRGIVVVEVCNDSNQGAIDLNEKVSDTSIVDADFTALGGGTGSFGTVGNLQGTGGGAGVTEFPGESLVIAYPNDAELIMKMPSYAGDGTTGIAHVYLRIETPVAP